MVARAVVRAREQSGDMASILGACERLFLEFFSQGHPKTTLFRGLKAVVRWLSRGSFSGPFFLLFKPITVCNRHSSSRATLEEITEKREAH